jgi:hypothetical protein
VAIKVIVTVTGAADILSNDATAVIRLDRDTTSAFLAPTEVTTTAILTGVERYEIWDVGATTTSWFRFQIESGAGVALSGLSIPWQVITPQPIATLASVKLRLGSGASSTDDDVLQSIIDGVNGAITQRIGYYPGPSSDTSRVYHGMDAVHGGRRLWLPGGVRSITALTLASSTLGAQTAATLTDFMLGPAAYELRPAEPYHYIEFKDVTTGNWSYFPDGYENVTATGTFGWGIVPDDLIHVASAMALRRWKARNSGDVDVLGSDEFGSAVISDRMPIEWRRVIDSYRFWRTV